MPLLTCHGCVDINEMPHLMLGNIGARLAQHARIWLPCADHRLAMQPIRVSCVAGLVLYLQ